MERQLITTLQAIIGAEHVITDRGERTFYSTDIFYETSYRRSRIMSTRST